MIFTYYIYRTVYRVSQVIEGYAKWIYDIITRSGSVYSVERLSVCRECKHNKKGICKLCGCVIKAKVRVKYLLDEEMKSIEGCPERKW